MYGSLCLRCLLLLAAIAPKETFTKAAIDKQQPRQTLPWRAWPVFAAGGFTCLCGTDRGGTAGFVNSPFGPCRVYSCIVRHMICVGVVCCTEIVVPPQ